jgi:predicted signal transduction protein with EAL and GGDEF domain
VTEHPIRPSGHATADRAIDTFVGVRRLINHLPMIVAGFDRDGVCILSEGGLLAEIGLAPGQVVGRSFFDIYGSYPEIVRDLSRCLAGEAFATNAVVADIAFETYYRPTVDDTGRPTGGSLVAIDVTERMQAVEALQRSEQFRQSLLQAIPDRMLHLSSDRTVLSIKPGADDAALTPSEWLGRPLEALIGQAVADTLTDLAERADADGGVHVHEYDDDVDGRRFEARAVPTGDGQVVAIIRDVTAQRTLQRQLTHQAYHDGLTGLPNRLRFRQRIDHALGRAAGSCATVWTLFIDLDGFKAVNDSYGHTTGDQLLVAVANRLRSCLRPTDLVTRLEARPQPSVDYCTIARLGGDEFAVLLERIPSFDVVEDVAHEILRTVGGRYELDGHDVEISASVGIAGGIAEEVDADGLLRNADLAMYAAKMRGKGRAARYSEEMYREVARRAELRSALRRAVDERQLTLEYQPIVALDTGQMEGVEALMRWRHPVWGGVSPATFVSAAEETGLIEQVGTWALRAACAQLRRWDEAGMPRWYVSVNVSPRQLGMPGAFALIDGARSDAGLGQGRLRLELTETQLLQDLSHVADRLGALSGAGIPVGIDDFGTGYASLNYLRHLPLSTLKLDRSFVSALGGSSIEADEALVRALVAMSAALRLDTVAEGIETAEQAVTMRRLGCRTGQGFYYCRPVPPDDIPRYRPPESVTPAPRSDAR